jgi:hypothetical protein
MINNRMEKVMCEWNTDKSPDLMAQTVNDAVAMSENDRECLFLVLQNR